jgi:hypothetical protein
MCKFLSFAIFDISYFMVRHSGKIPVYPVPKAFLAREILHNTVYSGKFPYIYGNFYKF